MGSAVSAKSDIDAVWGALGGHRCATCGNATDRTVTSWGSSNCYCSAACCDAGVRTRFVVTGAARQNGRSPRWFVRRAAVRKHNRLLFYVLWPEDDE